MGNVARMVLLALGDWRPVPLSVTGVAASTRAHSPAFEESAASVTAAQSLDRSAKIDALVAEFDKPDSLGYVIAVGQDGTFVRDASGRVTGLAVDFDRMRHIGFVRRSCVGEFAGRRHGRAMVNGIECPAGV